MSIQCPGGFTERVLRVAHPDAGAAGRRDAALTGEIRRVHATSRDVWRAPHSAELAATGRGGRRTVDAWGRRAGRVGASGSDAAGGCPAPAPI